MSSTPEDHEGRVSRARLSLTGVVIGDGFGERFFGPTYLAVERIESRRLPRPPWQFTDDSVMSLAVVEVLERCGRIDQDALARAFAAKYAAQPHRGYGAGAHRLLGEVVGGAPWRLASRALFGGEGSFGNGGAMRATPIGAYFADDLVRTADEARLAAEVTHAHVEGQAGAIAVAVAAACVATSCAPDELFELVLEHTPPGPTREGIAEAAQLPVGVSVHGAASLLGTGANVSSQDTVPFVIWCAARFVHDFETALWSTVAGLGDRDTTCAMVGGIVALRENGATIPSGWRSAQEPFAGLAGMGFDPV